MLMCFEVVLMGCVMFSVWRIMRNTFGLNVLLVCAFVAASAAAYGVVGVVTVLIRPLSLNMLVAAGISVGLSLAVYLVSFSVLGRMARRRLEGAKKGGETKRRSGVVGTVGNLLLSVVLVSVVAVVVAFLVELAAASSLMGSSSRTVCSLQTPSAPSRQ